MVSLRDSWQTPRLVMKGALLYQHSSLLSNTTSTRRGPGRLSAHILLRIKTGSFWKGWNLGLSFAVLLLSLSLSSTIGSSGALPDTVEDVSNAPIEDF